MANSAVVRTFYTAAAGATDGSLGTWSETTPVSSTTPGYCFYKASRQLYEFGRDLDTAGIYPPYISSKLFSHLASAKPPLISGAPTCIWSFFAGLCLIGRNKWSRERFSRNCEQ